MSEQSGSNVKAAEVLRRGPEPGLRLELRRVVKVSRRRAFEAWTRPEILKQWFGPGAMMPVEAFTDLNQGGGFRIVMEGPSPRTGDRMKITFYGGYREVIADRRIVMDWVVAGDPGEPTVVTVEFRDVAEGTEIVLTHEGIATPELLARNQMGWGSMLEKLSRVLAEG